MDKPNTNLFKEFEEILEMMTKKRNCHICMKIKEKPTEKTEPKEVKDVEFKVGNVVILKSGGIPMTVKKITARDYDKFTYTELSCIFMENGEFKEVILDAKLVDVLN